MIKATYMTHSGDDLLVVNAARVSFSKTSEWDAVEVGNSDTDDNHSFAMVESRLSARDTKLIGYLASHGHWTPFAHPQITMHLKAPIFVRTQCFKHKVGFVENEVSRRYVDDDPEFYIPEAWRIRAENAKQGSGGTLPESLNRGCAQAYDAFLDNAILIYGDLLGAGVAPEQARMVLPQSMMTEWFWTGSLAAWARFVKQRTHADAQAETAGLARQCAEIIAPLFPVSWKALVG